MSVDAGLGVYDKRLQFLSETARNLRKVRLLLPASTMLFWETGLAPLREATGRVGIRIAAALLSERLDRAAYERVFDEMEADRLDGLMVSHHGEHLTSRQLIADLAAKHRLPAIYPHREFVDVGGLLSYGSDLGDAMRRLADMTDQVMKGAKPADIPFYLQTKFELVLNRTTAKSLSPRSVAAIQAGSCGRFSGGIGGRSGSAAFGGGAPQEGGLRSRRRLSPSTASPRRSSSSNQIERSLCFGLN
ncbi:ABC transporter substrate binding protein [Bradyrhizobium sp. CIR18]|uniref:ABC transporter substrate binding protein n=1 Tax=Bradyrhizobium sp. CIR18 TaxID=2663839 RepID=UPI001606CF25